MDGVVTPGRHDKRQNAQCLSTLLLQTGQVHFSIIAGLYRNVAKGDSERGDRASRTGGAGFSGERTCKGARTISRSCASIRARNCDGDSLSRPVAVKPPPRLWPAMRSQDILHRPASGRNVAGSHRLRIKVYSRRLYALASHWADLQSRARPVSTRRRSKTLNRHSRLPARRESSGRVAAVRSANLLKCLCGGNHVASATE